RPDGDAGGLQVDQREADALLLFRVLAGAHQREDMRRLLRVGGPDLLAVDDELVAGTQRCSTPAGQIRAGARLGITLTPDVFAAEDARQEIRLLRGVATLDQRRPQLVVTEVDHARRADAFQLLVIDQLLAKTQPESAVFTRPGRRAPAVAMQQ